MAQLSDVFKNLDETLAQRVAEQVDRLLAPVIAGQRQALEDFQAEQIRQREEHMSKVRELIFAQDSYLSDAQTQKVQALLEKEKLHWKDECSQRFNESMAKEKCELLSNMDNRVNEERLNRESALISLYDRVSLLEDGLAPHQQQPQPQQSCVAQGVAQDGAEEKNAEESATDEIDTSAKDPNHVAVSAATALQAAPADDTVHISNTCCDVVDVTTSTTGGAAAISGAAVAAGAPSLSISAGVVEVPAVVVSGPVSTTPSAAGDDAMSATTSMAAGLSERKEATSGTDTGAPSLPIISRIAAAGGNADLGIASSLGPARRVKHFPWETAVRHGPPASRQPGVRRILYSMVALSIIILTVVLVALRKYPTSTIGSILLLFAWLLYLCGEEPLIQLVKKKAQSGTEQGRGCRKKWMILANTLRVVQACRSSHEQELKIQAVLHATCICFVLFNPDAGVLNSVLRPYPPTFAILVLAGALLVSYFIVYMIVERIHDGALRRGPARSGDTPRGNQAVQNAMKELQNCLQSRGRHQKRRGQKRIYDIFQYSDKRTLNDLLERMAQPSECSLERILLHFDDKGESPSRSELIDLLCVDLSGLLSVPAKSALLHTLMAIRLSSCRTGEAAVESLLVSAEGDDLSKLKCIQDGQGDIHSMHKLVFQDVTDETIRNRVLNHFLQEGTTQVAHRTLMECGHFQVLMKQAQRHGCVPKDLGFLQQLEEDCTPGGSRIGPSYCGKDRGKWLKVLTDMDDTLDSSGGKWPAGIDNRYPRHTTYPGVGAFYRELQGEESIGQLVALSARPHIVGEVMENRVFNKFRKLIKEQRLHSMPALLTGSVDAGGKFLLSGGDADGMLALAQKKCESFEQYIAMYPEFRVVFVGDNGQADYAVGKMMHQQHPHNIEQVWIHEVQARDKTWGYDPADEVPVTFFEDYVDAAISAVTRPNQPLISPAGLLRIVTAAVQDFDSIKNWHSEAQRETEVARLNRSIRRALNVLKSKGVDAEVELIPSSKPALSEGESGAASDKAESAPAPSDKNGWSLFGSFAKGSKAVAAPAVATSGTTSGIPAEESVAAETCREVAIQTDLEADGNAADSGAAVSDGVSADGGGGGRGISLFGFRRKATDASGSGGGPAKAEGSESASTPVVSAQEAPDPPMSSDVSADPPAESGAEGESKEEQVGGGRTTYRIVDLARGLVGGSSGGGSEVGRPSPQKPDTQRIEEKLSSTMPPCEMPPAEGSDVAVAEGPSQTQSASPRCEQTTSGRSLFSLARDFTKSALSSAKVQGSDSVETSSAQGEPLIDDPGPPDVATKEAPAEQPHAVSHVSRRTQSRCSTIRDSNGSMHSLSSLGAEDTLERTLPRAELSFESTDGGDPLIATLMQRAHLAEQTLQQQMDKWERQFETMESQRTTIVSQRDDLSSVLSQREAELQDLRTRLAALEEAMGPSSKHEAGPASTPAPSLVAAVFQRALGSVGGGTEPAQSSSGARASTPRQEAPGACPEAAISVGEEIDGEPLTPRRYHSADDGPLEPMVAAVAHGNDSTATTGNSDVTTVIGEVPEVLSAEALEGTAVLPNQSIASLIAVPSFLSVTSETANEEPTSNETIPQEDPLSGTTAEDPNPTRMSLFRQRYIRSLKKPQQASSPKPEPPSPATQSEPPPHRVQAESLIEVGDQQGAVSDVAAARSRASSIAAEADVPASPSVTD